MGIDGVDGVIRPATAALSASRAIWAVVTAGLVVILAAITVIAPVLVVTAVVTVIVASVFMTVIVALLVVSGAGSPFGFFGVGISVCYLYQFANGCRPLAI